MHDSAPAQAVVSRDHPTSELFVAGGVLPPDSPSYVPRPADDMLFDQLAAGQFCLVHSPRLMGKSSLMTNVARRLRKRGISSAVVYLSGIKAVSNLEQYYLGLLTRIKLQLDLPKDPVEWWTQQPVADPSDRFIDFFRSVLLAEIEGPLVIFIDEIEAAQNLDAATEFFATIRTVYDLRASEPIFERLTFGLLGTVVPGELVIDPDRSPFSIAAPIVLREFSQAEGGLLQQNLESLWPEYGEGIYDRVFYWTGGHPYLTQKLCATVAELGADGIWIEEQLNEQIDWLVKKQLLPAGGRGDPYLHYLRETLENSSQRRRLLGLYRRVYLGQKVKENEQSFEQNRLKLLGLIQAREEELIVSNQVFRQTFNLDWIEAHNRVDPRLKRSLIMAAVLLIFLLAGGLGFFMYRQRLVTLTARGEQLINRFEDTSASEDRLVSLAELFSLGGREMEARQLFYEELTPDEQLSLFEVSDPGAWAVELMTVARGLYSSPILDNGESGTALLQAMAQPLRQLAYSEHLDVIDLELEITNWLKGREHYAAGRARRAVEAYEVAISFNSSNPGTYFDRALAYAALGEFDRALEDFDTVLSLDQNWKSRVQQALIGDPALYGALWTDSGQQALAMLVPSPTSTPTPTITPTPTPTFTPTSTPTSIPATATPTATATSTPDVAAPAPATVPTATPASGPPSGTIVLVKPSLGDDPSHGLTTFEWQWSGGIPSSFGFEVRVWREGELHTGVHNAVLDNQNGTVQQVGANTYRLSTDIADATGVAGQTGEYLWTVALVQISPEYADVGQEAPPGRLRFAAIVPGGGGGGGDGGGGGGVGID